MNMNVTIRHAVAADAAAIKRVHIKTYCLSYKGFLPDNVLDALVMDRDVIERTRRYLEKTECFVALYQKRVVAYAYLVYPKPDCFEINALYVEPTFQRQGIGSFMLQTIFQEKKDLGFKKGLAWTWRDGPAVPFYQKTGFLNVFGVQKIGEFQMPIVLFEKQTG